MHAIKECHRREGRAFKRAGEGMHRRKGTRSRVP
jgi:hypothetical protein